MKMLDSTQLLYNINTLLTENNALKELNIKLQKELKELKDKKDASE